MELWITFLILIIPFIALVLYVRKRLKRLLQSALSYAVFVLCALVALDAYFVLMIYLARPLLSAEITDHITATSFAVIVFSYLLITINLMVVFVLAVINAFGKKKS